MERTPLSSRAVPSAGYDPQRQVLEIEFSTGRVYRYFDVPPSVFEWLHRTTSKGAYVSRMISERYRYEDVTPRPEPTDLLAALQASVAALSKPTDQGPPST